MEQSRLPEQTMARRIHRAPRKETMREVEIKQGDIVMLKDLGDLGVVDAIMTLPDEKPTYQVHRLHPVTGKRCYSSEILLGSPVVESVTREQLEAVETDVLAYYVQEGIVHPSLLQQPVVRREPYRCTHGELATDRAPRHNQE